MRPDLPGAAYHRSPLPGQKTAPGIVGQVQQIGGDKRRLPVSASCHRHTSHQYWGSEQIRPSGCRPAGSSRGVKWPGFAAS